MDSCLAGKALRNGNGMIGAPLEGTMPHGQSRPSRSIPRSIPGALLFLFVVSLLPCAIVGFSSQAWVRGWPTLPFSVNAASATTSAFPSSSSSSSSSSSPASPSPFPSSASSLSPFPFAPSHQSALPDPSIHPPGHSLPPRVHTSSSLPPSVPLPPHAARLQDLVDAGVLTVITRRPDYKDRRGDAYHEPEEIYLIGTAHTSQDSAAAVARVIREVHPCNVVLEMCKSRSGLTTLNDSTLLDDVSFPNLLRSAFFGARTPSTGSDGGPDASVGSTATSPPSSSTSSPQALALDRSLRLAGGRGPLLLQYCLVSAVKQLGKLLRLQFGEEFRAARQASVEVGAQVVLGDRPIELTLRRAWAAMTREERGVLILAMAALLLGVRPKGGREGGRERGGEGGAEEVVSAAWSTFLDPSFPGASLPPMFTRASPLTGSATPSVLTSSSPSTPPSTAPSLPPSSSVSGLEIRGFQGASAELLESLQRFSVYLPSLYTALIQERDRYLAWATKRSKAVNRSKRVVAVMGALHVPGVIAAIHADNGGDTLTFSTVARLPAVDREKGGGKGGVALTREYRQVLGCLVWAWGREAGPKILRDVAIGVVTGEIISMGWRLWGEEVMASVVASIGQVVGGATGGAVHPLL
ncbi:hypothetical protein NSK_008168 [Nannochloropsis salina CCMP1776]|uniref:TraB domain-containing protein n=1 Tax=Nannochloropsis salina CCMP1776 TaxID=1027361 RepID=A0A4D9CQY3_9STRA|nr:hypothetical protein NSK_008168 [Nannochloropsis salina CCMP1776]|eukprot:TFJ80427.1 hypothetical protein NSK_008168 [Nannochloropsis salina CCMP1776]